MLSLMYKYYTGLGPKLWYFIFKSIEYTVLFKYCHIVFVLKKGYFYGSSLITHVEAQNNLNGAPCWTADEDAELFLRLSGQMTFDEERKVVFHY